MKLPSAQSLCVFFSLFLITAFGLAQTDSAQPVFRLDGGNTTYAFGVNERGDLEPLYWGGRLGVHDSVPAARSFPELASFDPHSYSSAEAPFTNTECELICTFWLK